jgi:hypothetical protein
MLNKRKGRKENLIESQKWFTEGLKEGLAKSNMKQYPTWLLGELHGEKTCFRKDRHSDKTIIRFIGKPKIYFCVQIYPSLDPV